MPPVGESHTPCPHTQNVQHPETALNLKTNDLLLNISSYQYCNTGRLFYFV